MADTKRNPVTVAEIRNLIARSEPRDPLRNQFKRAVKIAEATAGKFGCATAEEIVQEQHKRLMISTVLRTESYKEVKKWLMRRINGRPPIYARPDIAKAYRHMRFTIREVFGLFRKQFAEHDVTEKMELEVARYIITKLTPPKYKGKKFDIMIGEFEGIPLGEHDIELE